MVDLLNKKKIKRLIARGNRLEAMNIFLQSKFGDSPKPYSNEKILNDSIHGKKKPQSCQNISEEINEINAQKKKGSNSATINEEDVVVVDVETVDPLSVEEIHDPLSIEEKMISSEKCQIATSVPHHSYLATTHNPKTSIRSDIAATPQVVQQGPKQGISIEALPGSLQMSSSSGQQTMMSQQPTNHHDSSPVSHSTSLRNILCDYQDACSLSQYGNSEEVHYIPTLYNTQVMQYNLSASDGNHIIRQNNWDNTPQEQQNQQQCENDHVRHPSTPAVSHLDDNNQSAMDTLKKSDQKQFRDQGRPYISRATGKEIKGRVMGPPCNCKKQCWSKVEAGAEEIFIAFWDMGNFDEQNFYLYGNISINPVRRHYVKGSNRRTYTFRYWVKVRGKHVEVCKETFMGIHGLQNSRGRIGNLMKQMKEGKLLPKTDQRGKHSNRPNKYTEEALKGAKQHIETFINRNITLKKLYRDYYLPWCEEQKNTAVSEDKYRRLYSEDYKIS